MNLLFLLLAEFLAWNAPTTNDDGTPLTDLDRYRVYRDSQAAAETTSTQCSISPVGDPTKFYVTAIDLVGNESKPSSEIIAVACQREDAIRAELAAMTADRDFWRREVKTAKLLRDSASKRETECLRAKIECCK